jgi:transposase
MAAQIVPVIMCGDADTRLWPVSRESTLARVVLTSRRECRESIRRARSVPLYTRLAPLDAACWMESLRSSMPILAGSPPEGCRYSRFCELYRLWESKLSATMPQAYVGGDKLFVDYAGDTAPVIDRLTGEVRQCNLRRRDGRVEL